MKRIGIPVPRALFFLLFWCFASAFTYPQSLRFDDFARQIDRELKPMKPHQVAVLDFRNTGDSGNLQGHYLAWLVSEALSEASNRSYKVANHKSFDDDLSKHHIIDALGPDPTHPSISPVIRADVLLTGTIAHENNGYLLRITPVFVTTKESLPSLSARIPATEFLDSMLGPLPSDVPELTTKSLWAEMNLPSCVYCPDPLILTLRDRRTSTGAMFLWLWFPWTAGWRRYALSNCWVMDSTNRHMWRSKNGRSGRLQGKRTERLLPWRFQSK